MIVARDCDPLRRFAWPRSKNRTFYDFCGVCGGRGSKTEDFLRFLLCALCGDNRGLFTILNMRARPSAEIRVVEVQKLRFFTISASRARPSAEIRGSRFKN